jgi:hypothetical protein
MATTMMMTRKWRAAATPVARPCVGIDCSIGTARFGNKPCGLRLAKIGLDEGVVDRIFGHDLAAYDPMVLLDRASKTPQ